MTKWQKYRLFLYLYFRYDLPESLRNIRRRIWNAGIKLWWYRLFIRKNELHKSLGMDLDAMIVMNKDEFEEYDKDLADRRWLADNRENSQEDREHINRNN